MSGLSSLRSALAIAGVALAGAFASPAAALADGEGAWCAEQGGQHNPYRNCGYHTFRQCQAAISGVGGSCSPNPRVITYAVEDEDGVRIHRRVYR